MLTAAVWLAWFGSIHMGFAGLYQPKTHAQFWRVAAVVSLTLAAILATIAINR